MTTAYTLPAKTSAETAGEKRAPADNAADLSSDDGSETLNDADQLPLKMMARIDLHVIPMLCVAYVMSFLDRVNISNALVYGLTEDLHLTGLQPNTAIAVLFVTYVLFEIPSTVLMKRFSPPIFLPIAMFMFGLFMLLQGFVQNFAGLVVLRLLMGAAEAGIYPACYYLISMWYRRTAAQRRFSFFSAGSSFAGAFGGLLASAIGKMEGVGGYSSWRWIFILEGLLTCLLSFAAFFLISDFPEKARWLSQPERAQVVKHLRSELGSSEYEKPVVLRDILDVFKDWKIFWAGPMYFAISVSFYGLANFIPSIIKTYKFSPITTQLYSVIPWAAGLGLTLTLAYISDKVQLRGPFVVFGFCLALTGNLILLNVHENRAAELAAVILYQAGCVSVVPIIVCWVSMNVQGHRQRAIAIPWMVSIGNSAGFVGAFAFPASLAPRYTLGYSLGLGFLIVFGAIVVGYIIGFILGNRKRADQVKYII